MKMVPFLCMMLVLGVSRLLETISTFELTVIKDLALQNVAMRLSAAFF